MCEVVMRRFVAIRASGNSSTYSPGWPGRAATGGTREEVRKNACEAIEMHANGLKERYQQTDTLDMGTQDSPQPLADGRGHLGCSSEEGA